MPDANPVQLSADPVQLNPQETPDAFYLVHCLPVAEIRAAHNGSDTAVGTAPWLMQANNPPGPSDRIEAYLFLC